jgi:hypothetical protein
MLLPALLAGITEMRNAYMEKEESKKLKQKQRDRMSAKTGKMDIAYEVRTHGVLFTPPCCPTCRWCCTSCNAARRAGNDSAHLSVHHIVLQKLSCLGAF